MRGGKEGGAAAEKERNGPPPQTVGQDVGARARIETRVQRLLLVVIRFLFFPTR